MSKCEKMGDCNSCGYRVDTESLPDKFPTHRYPSEFCEALGRVVMTFCYLEERLFQVCRILMIRECCKAGRDIEQAKNEVDRELQCWEADPLGKLIEHYQSICKQIPGVSVVRTEKVIEYCKDIRPFRNAPCHASWGLSDPKGKFHPKYVDRFRGRFDAAIDVGWLNQMQRHTAEVIAEVESTWMLLLGSEQ